jgi:two-component sensor histidine kinase
LATTGGCFFSISTAKIQALIVSLSSIADITERKRAQEGLHVLNAQLEQRVRARTSELKERESLLQEIHHRVKNNLQVISSLINMQMRGLEDESSRAALRDCQSRVMTVAQIHQILYQSADYARVPFAQFARDLTTRILSASGTSPGNVTLCFELDEVLLPVAQAIPCGLLLGACPN